MSGSSWPVTVISLGHVDKEVYVRTYIQSYFGATGLDHDLNSPG